jgi:TolB protein
LNLWSMLRHAVRVPLLLSIIFSATLYAQVTLRTETTSVGRLDVVVHPFKAVGDSAFVGALPQTIRDLVRGDLEYSGYFNLISSEDLPSDTTIQIKRVGNSFDTLWTFTGSSAARIHGSITVGWEEVTAAMAIFQPPYRDPIHMDDFKFKSDDMRFAAHTIASWITEMLTGERGAFTSKIVFVVRTGQNKDLWVMDWDGANAQSLTRDQTLNISPTWAPDGKHLFFTSFRMGNADIYKYDMETGKASPFVVSPKVDSAPSVSLDGEWVAYASSLQDNFEIYKVHQDGSEASRITFSYRDDTSPSWSPTGREIVFTSDRSGSPQIYIMAVEGIDVRRLSFEGVYNDTPRWSPRGDIIAFCSRESNAFPRFQIFTISPGGGKERRLTKSESNFDPCWSPDGMKLVYTADAKRKTSIWTCNWDGSNHRQLTFGIEASQPQWGPSVSNQEVDN